MGIGFVIVGLVLDNEFVLVGVNPLTAFGFNMLQNIVESHRITDL